MEEGAAEFAHPLQSGVGRETERPVKFSEIGLTRELLDAVRSAHESRHLNLERVTVSGPVQMVLDQLEKGWVLAAATARPFSEASLQIERRRRTTSARTSSTGPSIRSRPS